MKTIAAFVLALLTLPSHAGEQSRFYAPDGRSIGTAVPLGAGSMRYYDARGRSTGTSTTSGGATTVYDSRGRVISRAQHPSPPLRQ
jgi:YD repeat-containing protein